MGDELLSIPAAPRAAPIHQGQASNVPVETSVQAEITALLATRADYMEERTWHRFLLDAYGGTGGFQGKVSQPLASFWGWAADVYRPDLLFADGSTYPMEYGCLTYLDRFDREDEMKFKRRREAVHYPNYVSNFIDVPLSFMFRKPFQQQPEEQHSGSLGKWEEDADGAGNSFWNIIRDTIAPRAAVLGYCPVLFDMPNSATRMPTALDDEREKKMPYVVPLFPSNVLDWNHDDQGTLRWAKIRNDYVLRDNPLELGREVTRITIWFADRWEWYELARDATGRTEIVGRDEGTHPFKRVPLLFLRRKPVPDDHVRGIPLAGSSSEEARRLFNYLSELDEHLKSCAFAFLQFVTDQPDKVGQILAGSGNALPIKPDWKNTHAWVMPDTKVAAMYEKRIEVTIEEMYRAAKLEFTRGTRGGNARSGVSQSFEFESANRSIADFARMVARFDQEARRLVASVIPGAPSKDKITTTAPVRFDVEEMAKELDEALSAITLRLGPTATAEIRKKVVRGVLPMLDTMKWGQIESEIDEQAELERKGAAQLAAADIDRAIQAARGNLDDPKDVDEELTKQEGAQGDELPDEDA